MVIPEGDYPWTGSEEKSPSSDDPAQSFMKDDGYPDRARKLRLQIEELRAHLARLQDEHRRFRTD
jgi:hypothetical protein